jgi:hypothetical protein
MSTLPSVRPRLRRDSGGTKRMDHLGWTVGICFDAFGVRVGVRSNEPRLLDRLSPHLPPGWKPTSSRWVDRLFSLWIGRGGPAPVQLYAGGQRRLRTASLDEALVVLESEIRQGVAAGAPSTFVHAGVVGWRGHAIVVPGRSRSGKTTLVAELVRAGASYYSDEFAVFDGRGRVHPFAKPLSVRGEGGCDRHGARTRAEDLGGTCGREPLRTGLVVLATFRPRADWRPERLSRGRAVLEMLAHTAPARLRPERSLRTLERALAGAVVLKGERSEARDLVSILLGSREDGAGITTPPAAEERGVG